MSETKKIFGKRQKIRRDFWTQRVYQGVLKTRRLIEMEKGKARENGQRKTSKTTNKMGCFLSGVANFVIELIDRCKH
jgi:hypothetical protein